MTSAIVFPLDEAQQYDEIVSALDQRVKAELRTSSGESLEIPDELLEVLLEAARYLARGKAVSVTPHSRFRFL